VCSVDSRSFDSRCASVDSRCAIYVRESERAIISECMCVDSRRASVDSRCAMYVRFIQRDKE